MSKLDTRSKFVNALMDLLKEKAFENVTVEDIIKKSGASRPTFYRYFKDKYELMTWIYIRELELLGNQLYTASYKYLLIQNAIYLKEYQEYFANVVKFKGQNSFAEFLSSYALNCFKEQIIKRAGTDKLTDDVLLSLKMYTFGLVSLVLDWLNSGLKEPPEKIAKIACDNMPKPIKKLLE